MYVCGQLISCVLLFVIPWTAARQVLLSMGFSRQEYWSRLLFSFRGNLLDPGIEFVAPAASLALQEDSLLLSHLGSHVSCQMVLNVKEKNKASLEGIWTVGEGLQF